MPIRKPTPEEINQACLSYRHDFGLLSPEEQQKIRTQAEQWLEAWLKLIPKE
jgi:hypothetical protein